VRGGRSVVTIVLTVALALVAGGCGDDDNDDGSAAGPLRVFAAASLTEAFTELGNSFERANPDVDITFNFAASSALAQQINDGAPADVFVSADDGNMKKVTDAGNATDPKVIARNRLAILVEQANPKGITGLGDLGHPDVVFVLCAPEVPCGKFAAAALAKAGVTATPASLEENVKAVVAKVTLGEADAGIVYATDVRASAGKAEGVDIDIADDPDLEAVYPIALTGSSTERTAARAWIDYVLSDSGQATLARFGFLSP
jgi:molybdate transport system substrate-binding protein